MGFASNLQLTPFSDHSPVAPSFVTHPLLSLRQGLGDQSIPGSLQVTKSPGSAPTERRTDPFSEMTVKTLGTWSQLTVPMNLTVESDGAEVGTAIGTSATSGYSRRSELTADSRSADDGKDALSSKRPKIGVGGTVPASGRLVVVLGGLGAVVVVGSCAVLDVGGAPLGRELGAVL